MRQILSMFLFTGLITACNSNKITSENNQTKMSNKEKAIAFVSDALSNQNEAVLREITREDIIQHNPTVPNGTEVIINNVLPALKAAGTHAKIARVFTDGDFVVTHNHWKNATPFGGEDLVAFDIYRFDEEGKIAEHWDALQPMVKETASGRSQIDGPTEISDLDKTEANKALAVSLVEDVLMGKNPAKITEYISAEEYNQHNPQIKDGLSGIVEAVEFLTSQNNMFKYTNIHKVLGEGNFVLTISEGEWSGKSQVFYDLFRMKEGKIVEHWDVIQEIPTEGLANDNGMFGF